MNVFESIMLVCFGSAWPISIYRSVVSKTTAGKSLLFMIVLQIGYIAGILFKVTEYLANSKINSSPLISINLCLYIINLSMITIDVCLFMRNRKIERAGQV